MYRRFLRWGFGGGSPAGSVAWLSAGARPVAQGELGMNRFRRKLGWSKGERGRASRLETRRTAGGRFVDGSLAALQQTFDDLGGELGVAEGLGRSVGIEAEPMGGGVLEGGVPGLRVLDGRSPGPG